MLKFAAVGCHGRECGIRLALCALLTFMWAAPAIPQAAPAVQPLLLELAVKIAATIAPATQISLAPASPSGSGGGVLQPDAAGPLSARGLRVVTPADGTPSVRISCLENLREQSCV